MKQSLALSSATLLCLLAGATLGGGVSAAEKEAEKPSECCFTREGARQLCRVTPGDEETCASILEYLNTPGSAGKSYCAGNKLRGGWQAADCSKDDSRDDTGGK